MCSVTETTPSLAMFLNIQIQLTSEKFWNGQCLICFEKGNISDNCTMSYPWNTWHGCGKYSIGLCLQKSENSETKADENNKKNGANVNSLPTENSNTIVPTTAVLKVTMFYYKQPVQKLPTKESVFLRTNVRISFDSGSQRSYLNVDVKERLFIKPLANYSFLIKELDVVEVKSKVKYNEIFGLVTHQ